MKYVIPIVLILFSYSQAGADARGSLWLEGSTPLHFDIRIQPNDNVGSIDLAGGETNLKIADVLEVSNLVIGYDIAIESVNGGVLLHNNGTSSVPYQIQYTTAGTPITPPPSGSPAIVKSSGALVGLTFTIEEVFFTTPANTNLIGGAYTDTLIISIQAP